MPLVCPRPCGRLATGAIFISVGVVQLIAAVILLRSKYVYLLSAPNIWTAFSNIAVGGLLGVSAGVWKNTSKRSSKHAVRRNILAALATSAILMNTTTTVILIMGEGNTLLSIHLENNGIDSSTLASEILAYAYAASVCSPILCVVVAIIFLSGMCFPKGKKSFEKGKKTVFESGSSTFNWVYKTEQHGRPIPDPEIVRKALSSKSFASSDDSCSSTEFPIRTDSIHDLHTLKKGINRIENPHGSTFPQTIHQRTECTENYSDTISHSGNRVSFVDDPSVSDRTILKHVQTELENGSVKLCSPPKLKTKKRGDLYALIYDAPRNVCQNEERQRLEGIHRIPHRLDTSVTVDTSVISERDNHIPPKVSEETEYSSPDADNFGKNLRGFEHEHLRRTSTTAGLNYLIGMLDQETSQRDIFFKNPIESLNHTMVKKTISGENSNTLIRNSNRDLLDQTDRTIDSRTDSLLGEVVPIRVNTVPKKKLPAKLIPVSIPVVSNINTEYLPKRKDVSKFDDARIEGFSSFRVGHQVKNRSKSTGSHSAKHSEPTFAVATPKVAVSEIPVEEANLQLSPTHTSGYISALEDTVEPSSQDPSKSNKATTSNSSTYAGSGSSRCVTARKKFRAAQRKLLDGGRPLSETDAINDIVMQMISENPQLSNKESITELFFDLLLQKIAHQSAKDEN